MGKNSKKVYVEELVKRFYYPFDGEIIKIKKNSKYPFRNIFVYPFCNRLTLNYYDLYIFQTASAERLQSLYIHTYNNQK